MILYVYEDCIRCETAMQLMRLHDKSYILVPVNRYGTGPLIEEYPNVKYLPFAVDGFKQIKSITRLSRHLLNLE